jgi:uncharacterized protein involved in exopolysaccharide biosynthesis
VAILPLLKKYTIGLPGLLLNKQTDNNENLDTSLFQITEQDKDLFELLAQVVSIEVDDQEGLVSISVELADRMVAAQLAQAATDLLQSNVIAFKSQSARNNLDFIESQFESKRKEFEEIQDSIAIFKDQNLNITSALYQNQLTRLESQFTVISSVFQELAGQVEQAKIQVNRDTPIFTIIEPVSVPLERSKPKRTYDGGHLDVYRGCVFCRLGSCEISSTTNCKRASKLTKAFFSHSSSNKKEHDIPNN